MNGEMMKRVLPIVAMLFILHLWSLAGGQNSGGSLTFSVVDERKVIARNIDRDLLLRVVKDSSIKQQNFGWDVQVIQKPFDSKSLSNLLYHSREWHGPYPSQVDAWHVTEKYFQNERELEVRGYPYRLKIVLVNPVVEGTGSDTRFVSGRVKISWRRKP